MRELRTKTAEPKRDLTGEIKKADSKDKTGRKYWIINNYEKDDWRAYRDIYVGIPFDFPEDFIKKNILLIQ